MKRTKADGRVFTIAGQDDGTLEVIEIRTAFDRKTALLNGEFPSRLAALMKAEDDLVTEKARVSVALSRIRRQLRRARGKA